MSYHLIGWQQSVDQAALAAIATVVDDILTRTGTTRYIVPPVYNQIYWAMALGPSLTRAQIITPSLQVKRQNPEVAPRRRGAEALSLGFPEVYVPNRPIVLTAGEEIEFQAAEDGVGATQMDGFVALGPDKLPPMPAGDIRRVRATGSTALTARAWTSVNLTLDSSLEAGKYQLVNFIAISANAIAARAIITGQNFRPGLPAFAGAEGAAVDFLSAKIDEISWFAMGEFSHITVPAIQFFSSAADASETVYLDVIRTGNA